MLVLTTLSLLALWTIGSLLALGLCLAARAGDGVEVVVTPEPALAAAAVAAPPRRAPVVA